MNGRRAELVEHYQRRLGDIGGFDWIKAAPGWQPSWHMFTVLLDRRDDFISGMRERGIAVGMHYRPLHLYEIASEFCTELPVTERLWTRVTTFPLYPDMTEPEQDRVLKAAAELSVQPGLARCSDLRG